MDMTSILNVQRDRVSSTREQLEDARAQRLEWSETIAGLQVKHKNEIAVLSALEETNKRAG